MKRASPLRLLYWVVMLAAIGVLLFLIHRMLLPYQP